MIDVDSRYYDGNKVVLVNETTIVRRRWPVPNWRFKYHTWSSHDRLDNLADQYLRDHTLWWKILDANPKIMDPANIRLGTQIRIPLPSTGETYDA